jgi:catechol 2,3-dioxygenase-like lactoylglutathione lyase family enzyme
MNGDGSSIVDLKMEVVVIPVADADRAKEFYGRLGWRLDADFPFDNGFRVVQFTPPGSACSVQFGLAAALRRAEAAHGEHEKRTGQADANWPGWYAAYMVAERAGTELPA